MDRITILPYFPWIIWLHDICIEPHVGKNTGYWKFVSAGSVFWEGNLRHAKIESIPYELNQIFDHSTSHVGLEAATRQNEDAIQHISSRSSVKIVSSCNCDPDDGWNYGRNPRTSVSALDHRNENKWNDYSYLTSISIIIVVLLGGRYV